MPKSKNHQTHILVTGVTGATGRLIAAEIEASSADVTLRYSSRRPEQVEAWRADGKDAVLMDFDDPTSFGPALAGIDRLYIITAYTVDMLVHSKTLVDAAVKAGVTHIVHQGLFAAWDVTDPHCAWHKMIETYIEASGIAWTHLHPNYFMENFINLGPIQDGTFTMFVGDKGIGLIALKDLAAVAAKILIDGDERHAGKNYWLSTEVLNGAAIAEIFSDVLGKKIECTMALPEHFDALLKDLPPELMEPNYGKSIAEFFRQIVDGRMGYIGTVRDDVPHILGREATSFSHWVKENKALLGR